MDNDTASWLNQIGLSKYNDIFAENDIDRRALPHLTEDDLKELGVTLGHRKIIMAAIGELIDGDAPHAQLLAVPTEEPTSHEPREAERRHLSIMFCDLVDSTALSESLDPEVMRELLRRYQDAVAGCITRYDGHVAKYLGDGVLAYFGWPMAYEDQAERAVRAGLEALEVVAALSMEGADKLAARVGVATGEVVVGDLVGNSGRETGAVAGDTPNLAARLQSIANPGTLLVADTTYRAIGSGFEVETKGSQQLKGFQRAVNVYQVIAERAVESRFEATHGDQMLPFVGRVHELGMLNERWQAAQSGQGQMVFVTGEPGIGKSRLVEAFCQTINTEHFQLIRMQCSPYLSESAYHPIIERLSRAAELAPSDTAAERLKKIEKSLILSGEDANAVVPVYADLLTVALDKKYEPLDLQPQALKELTLKTLVERFGSIARDQPTVLILEDAHWIDPSTQEMLERLMPRLPGFPALLIVTHRPEWSPEWAAGYPHCSTVSISRIARDHIAELVGAVMDEEPTSNLLDEIASRTDGVPLFVVELARSVSEATDTVQERSDIIPETLQGSLMARLDRLPAGVKSVAQTASVIGRDFDRELLSKVLGSDTVTLDAAIDQLHRAQIIMHSAVSIEAFTFRHALIQDAAYQSLLNSRRRSYHDIIAEILVADHSDVADTQPELVARHFAEAERHEDALPLWKRASERALARSANLEAIKHCERALGCVKQLREEDVRLSEQLACSLVLATAQSVSGNIPGAMETFTQTAEQAREMNRPKEMAAAALGYDNALFLSNERDRTSIELLKPALALLPESEEALCCQVLGRLARAYLLLGEYQRAQDYNAQTIVKAQALNDQGALFDVLINQFLVPNFGTPLPIEERQSNVDRIIETAGKLSDKDALGRAHSLDIYFSAETAHRQRFDDAVDSLVRYGESNEMLHLIWVARHAQSMQAILDGAFVEAERFAEAAHELGQQTHGDGVEGVYGIQMFTIRREQGRLAEVAPVVKHLVDENPGETAWKPGFALIACDLGFEEPAQRMLHDIASDGFNLALDAKRSTTLAYLAEVCAILKDERYAEALYELLQPYRDMTITAGVATVCLGATARYLGLLATVLGDWDRAERHFKHALKVNEKMHAQPWLAHSQHDYARMLQQRNSDGDADHAHELIQQSLAVAKKFGMVSLEAKLQGSMH
jgi:class 3 adenylate cyclase/tetratricopeptide (TPR) repeat protein